MRERDGGGGGQHIQISVGRRGHPSLVPPRTTCRCREGGVKNFFKLPGLFKLTNTEPFAAWFVVTGDATVDEIRVARSVLGAISCLPIVAAERGKGLRLRTPLRKPNILDRRVRFLCSHQPPEVNYSPCFENDDLPCRLHEKTCSLQGESSFSKRPK